MKNIRFFYLKNCHFLMVKFSIYLNRRVFVMFPDKYGTNIQTFHSRENIFVDVFLLT